MSLRETILNNLGWKLFSLGLALLTWFFMSPDFPKFKKSDTSVDARQFPLLPIKVNTPPEDQQAYRIEPDNAELLLTGPPGLLKRTLARDIRVFVDLTDPPGEKPVLRKVLVLLPAGLTNINQVPDHVLVERIPATPDTPRP